MSQANVELVRYALFPERLDLIDVFMRGEFDRLFDLSVLDPDVEVFFAQPVGPGVDFTGIEGLVEGWRDWLAPWARYEVVVEDYIDAGDRVVVLAFLRGETERGHVQIEQLAAAVVTVADGKVTRLEFHLDRKEALESAGIAS